MNVIVAFPSIVQTRPFSHATIILFPNVPTWSNVNELWSACAAPDLRKERDGTSRELKDVKAFCDENVASR